jgi:signal transduction protein with GAF and PtsI domain
VDATARHLRLLTETIAAVNSTLDLEEVLALVASKVAEALEADACFVYLYDERADELVLRATHGTRVEEMTRRPRRTSTSRSWPSRSWRGRSSRGR